MHTGPLKQPNIKITTIEGKEDIHAVIALQQANLPANIPAETAASQGFVTVQHDFLLLEKMNQAVPQLVAKDGERVVGYALVMLPSFQEMIPVLKSMFAIFDQVEYRQRKITDYNYYVMGQVCIAEGYRGRGIFDQLYLKHKELFSQDFDFCITEIALRNVRSMKAHQRAGFETIHTYRDETDHWAIVLWDWA